MPFLRSAVDPAKFTTPLELCSSQNPPREIPKPTNSTTTQDYTWPEVDIENVTELEDFTYDTVLSAFKHILTLQVPYSPDVIKHIKERAHKALSIRKKHEKHFMNYCENWLMPMLTLIIDAVGPTYHIDFDIIGSVPEIEKWPAPVGPTEKEPDFGCVYKLTASRGKKTPLNCGLWWQMQNLLTGVGRTVTDVD